MAAEPPVGHASAPGQWPAVAALLVLVVLAQAGAHAGALVGLRIAIPSGSPGWALMVVPMLALPAAFAFAQRRAIARPGWADIGTAVGVTVLALALWERVYEGTLARVPPTVDFAHHTIIADEIARTGALPRGATGNLGGLWGYPPGFHVTSALTARVFGIDILRAVNLVSLCTTLATVAATSMLAARLLAGSRRGAACGPALRVATMVPAALCILAWPYSLGSVVLSFFAAQHYSVFHLAVAALAFTVEPGRNRRDRRDRRDRWDRWTPTIVGVGVAASAVAAFPRHAIAAGVIIGIQILWKFVGFRSRASRRLARTMAVAAAATGAAGVAAVVAVASSRGADLRFVAANEGGITRPGWDTVGGLAGAVLLVDGLLWAIRCSIRPPDTSPSGSDSASASTSASARPTILVIGTLSVTAGLGLALLAARGVSDAVADSVSRYTATKQFPPAWPFAAAVASLSAATLAQRLANAFDRPGRARPSRVAWAGPVIAAVLVVAVARSGPVPYIVTLETLNDDTRAIADLAAVATSKAAADTEVVLAVRGMRAYTLLLLHLRGPIADPSIRVETGGPVPLQWDRPTKKRRLVVVDSLSLAKQLEERPGWSVIERRGRASLMAENPA